MNEENLNINHKQDKNFGFSNALYFQLPNIDDKLKEISEGVENLKLNSNIITPTLTPRTSDPKAFEFYKNFISSDLLKRLEGSPLIRNNTSDLNRRFSEIFLMNCDKDEKNLENEIKNTNEKDEKIENSSKTESPDIYFDENALNLKNLTHNKKNYLPKKSMVEETDSLHSKVDCNSIKMDNGESIVIPINFNLNKSDSPRHSKPVKYADSKSSPIYNYYNSSSENLSQFFTGNYNNNSIEKINNDPMKFEKFVLYNNHIHNNYNMNDESNSNNFHDFTNLNDISKKNPDFGKNELSNLDPSFVSGQDNNNYSNFEEISRCNNFPIFSKLPQKNINNSLKYKNENNLNKNKINGKSIDNNEISELEANLNKASKMSERNYEKSLFEEETNCFNLNENPYTGNFNKININQSQNEMNFGSNNNYPFDNFKNAPFFFKNYMNNMINNYSNLMYNSNFPENPSTEILSMQNNNFMYRNQTIDTGSNLNYPDEIYCENGNNQVFYNKNNFAYNHPHSNNSNFNLNNNELMKNQFWQKNFGIKNNFNNNFLANNRSHIDHNSYIQPKGNYSSKFDPEDYIVEMFGKRGWICEKCNNFNYESTYALILLIKINIFYIFLNYILFLARTKCNRCAIPKMPKKITSKKNKFNININKTISIVENGNVQNKLNSKILQNNEKNVSSNIYEKESNFNEINNTIAIKNTLDIDCSPKELLTQTETDIKTDNLNGSFNSNDKKNKRSFVERVGDWICSNCGNLNFSFRVMCNRCQISKQESEMLQIQYTEKYNNFIRFNEMIQSKILMNHPINFIQNQGFNNYNINAANHFSNDSDFSDGFIEGAINNQRFIQNPKNQSGFDFLMNNSDNNVEFYNNSEQGIQSSMPLNFFSSKDRKIAKKINGQEISFGMETNKINENVKANFDV